MIMILFAIVFPFLIFGCADSPNHSNSAGARSVQDATVVLIRSEYVPHSHLGIEPTQMEALQARWLHESEKLSDLELISAVSKAYRIVLDEIGFWEIISGPSASGSQYATFLRLTEDQKNDVARGESLVFLSLHRGRFNI